MLAKVADARGGGRALARGRAQARRGRRPSSGSRRSACRPRCGRGRRAAAGTATATPRPGQCERDLVTLLLRSRRGPRARSCRWSRRPTSRHEGAARDRGRAAAATRTPPPRRCMAELPTTQARGSAGHAARRGARRSRIARRRSSSSDAGSSARSGCAGCATVSQTVAEAQSAGRSSAVPMDASVGIELHRRGAVVYELVGGAAQRRCQLAVESDPSRSPRSPDA